MHRKVRGYLLRSFDTILVVSTFVCSIILMGCQGENQQEKIFKKLDASRTGVNFQNTLEFRQRFNIYTYRNFYNGGGVGLGDVNNDGLIDIYFTSNMGDNALYLNKGNLTFEDITQKAGVAGRRSWSTGVSMVDINADGLLDIYVCNSGIAKNDDQKNELFINNGDTTFTERAEKYGLADPGLSIHASFFDYDKDGDLDMYLVNNSFKAIGEFDLENNLRDQRDPLGGDKLFRNDNGSFTDVSEEAGILGSIIAFGLGVTVGDINRDGWQDVYISNDFFERDYLYINNKDGTFSEQLEQQMRSISAASMGADMADIDNDGWMDLFVTEMLPEYDARLKTVTTFESWPNYQKKLDNDYYHQFTRNMLHLNNGDDTFSEIGRLAGVEATDWSWGALIADYDNDGRRDIFVSNGVLQDLTNQDYLRYIANPRTVQSIITSKDVNFRQLIDTIPSNRIHNYLFENQGDLRFQNRANQWGIGDKTHSNGSAYGDLDNDGDLDLVLNNLNMPSSIYENQTNTLHPGQHHLQIKLNGSHKNKDAIGAQVTLKTGKTMFFAEKMPMRGFQSSVDPKMHFGLGSTTTIDTVTVNWPDGKRTQLTNLPVDTLLVLHHGDTKSSTDGRANKTQEPERPVFESLDADKTGIDFIHKENTFNEFKRNKLLFHMNSTEGPPVCVGDVNGDEREDIFIGGAKGQSSALYLQNRNGNNFTRSTPKAFKLQRQSEDTDCEFFDADDDNDLDLYVTSGGVQFSSASSGLFNHLYINMEDGKFVMADQSNTGLGFESTAAVTATDYNGDGNTDLFLGNGMKLFKYGEPAAGYLLTNNGDQSTTFSDVTAKKAPALKQLGLVTDAEWIDYDADGDQDLLVAGRWMPLRIFENENGLLSEVTEEAGLGKTNGWWNGIEVADFNNDGYLDFAAGNLGLNSRFKASPEKPMRIYVNDFDYNGSTEQIITRYEGKEAYTLALRHNMLGVIPGLKRKYPDFADYKNQTIYDIFDEEEIEESTQLEMYELRSKVFLNQNGSSFTSHALPLRAQFTPLYGLKALDANNDGHTDLVIGGNLYNVKPELGPYDAGVGGFLKGDGNGEFTYVPSESSGIFNSNRQQVRAIRSVKVGGEHWLLMGVNDGKPIIYKINNH